MNKFSIILCTYNGNYRIESVVDSIINQNNYEKYVNEILIIDNNSNDNTKEIIFNLIKKNNKIKYYYEKEQGLSYARLKGIKNSISPWIIFIDDDNILHENWINEAIKYIENNKNIGAFNGTVIPKVVDKINSDKLIVLKYVLQGLACTNLNLKNIKLDSNKHPYKIPFGAGLVIRSHPLIELSEKGWLNSVGRTSDKLISCEDTEMCLYVKKRGYKFGYNPKMIISHIIDEKRLESEYLYKLWKGFAIGNYGILKKSSFSFFKKIAYIGLLYLRMIRDEIIVLKNKDYNIKKNLNCKYRKTFIECFKNEYL